MNLRQEIENILQIINDNLPDNYQCNMEITVDSIMEAIGSVKVAPLEWDEDGDNLFSSPDTYSNYHVRPLGTSFFYSDINGYYIGKYNTLPEAQSACQQHFEQLIMGSLVVGDKL
jgi:hypothetical protein